MEKISIYKRPKIWAAKMNVTVPDYSSEYYSNAVKAMKYEIQNLGIELLDPEYTYITALETERDDEDVDLVIYVGVKDKGIDSDSLKFKELDAEREMLRIEASNFDDIHIGLAEWMHENDYEADGPLRRILHEQDYFIYDCPIKHSES